MTCEELHLCDEYANDFLAFLKTNGAKEEHIAYVGYLLRRKAELKQTDNKRFDSITKPS